MTPAAAPRTAAIVLNWNNFDESRGCIDSLLASDEPALHVVLVDNASTDGSAQRLRSAYPGVAFVQNAANLGFAAGVNAGLRHAAGIPSVRYFVVVNNDCRLEPDAIRHAVDEARSDPAIGLVTPKILFDPRSRRIWHAGGRISVLRGQARSRGWGEEDRGQYNTADDTGWASGALMLITREVAERVGLFCEEYFFGLEEWDYSVTVRRAGYRIRYCPGFVGYHGGDGSHANYEPRYVYNYYRNKLVFQDRHLPRLLRGPWTWCFRLYVRFGLRAQSTWLARRHGTPLDRQWLDDVQFAASRALADHRRDRLSPEALERFSDALRARGRDAPGR